MKDGNPEECFKEKEIAVNSAFKSMHTFLVDL